MIAVGPIAPPEVCAQGVTRGTDAPPRVFDIDLDTRDGRERVLILAEAPLERSVDSPREGTLRVRLAKCVLGDDTPRTLTPSIEGAVRAVRAVERVIEGVQIVEVEVDFATGLQAKVSERDGIVAVEFPKFLRPDSSPFAMHFVDESLDEVVKQLANETGERFVFDDRLVGTVTITAPDRVTREEALSLLDAALFMRGFAAVQGPGDFRKIIPIAEALTAAPWDPERPSAEQEAPITTLLRLERADLDAVLQALAPSLGVRGLALPMYRSQSVILAGNEAQLHRWIGLAQALDRAHDEEVRILRIAQRPAAEVAPLLLDLAKRDNHSPESVSIWVQERSNALIVRASPARFEDIRFWAQTLDRAESADGELRVIRLSHSDPEAIADHMRALATGSSSASGRGVGDGGAVRALEGLTVAVHEATNSLLVRASPEGHALLAKVVRELDLRPPQVAVEITVVEVRVREGRELGLHYAFTVGDPESRAGDIFGTISRIPEGGFPDLASNVPADFAGRVRQEVAIPVIGAGGPTELLFPLHQVLVTADGGKAQSRILMRPHFVATNGEEQEFFVGDVVPIPVAADAGDTPTDPLEIRTNIQREDVGLRLRVKPSIGQAGGVTLDLELDVTSVGEVDERLGATLLQRRLTAAAHLRDEEFAVIGFSSRARNVESDTRAPFLGDIPFFGWLFGSETKRKERNYFIVAAQASVQRDSDEQLAHSLRARLALERSLAQVGDLRSATGVHYALLIATREEATQAETIAQRLPLEPNEEAHVNGWEWEGRNRFDVLVTGFRSLSSAGEAVGRLVARTGYHPRVIAMPADAGADSP